MKSEARVRQKMATVSVQVDKMVVAPVNQIPGLLETEVGTAWLGASIPPLAHLRFIGHKPASSHVSLWVCFFFFPGCWLLRFFTNPTERRPASSFFALLKRNHESSCRAGTCGREEWDWSSTDVRNRGVLILSTKCRKIEQPCLVHVAGLLFELIVL